MFAGAMVDAYKWFATPTSRVEVAAEISLRRERIIIELGPGR